ncbi:thiamine phosphate synthase [Leekyejoonella antrihumi]|uniref:Thiamine-phosphate synthase n=1 Tax=Leekyejoonella antrihumi TaxID=1660198 RepID=A0A563E2A3_9MICO|nr:thiamine phosphate synthase [Leekyejoonella antrihumi]TWP36331.1 thiamine phosphate synthase [Leekyejoonella antrihumi]
MNPIDLRVYLVTDTALCGARGVSDTVRAAVAGGVTVVQLRDHAESTRALCRLAESLREVLAGTGVPLIIDDRLDVALAVGADGVHVGQSDMDPRTVRRLVGPDLVIGHSVSTPQEARAVADLPEGSVDYLGIGPFRATPTKPNAAAPLGASGIADVVATTSLPTVAIGGIKQVDVRHVLATGVGGVAVVSAICAADDPQRAAAELRASVEGPA